MLELKSNKPIEFNIQLLKPILRVLLKSLFEIILIFLISIYFENERSAYLAMFASLFVVLTFITKPPSGALGSVISFFYGIILVPALSLYFVSIVRNDSLNILIVLSWSIFITPIVFIGYAAGWLNELLGKLKIGYQAIIDTKEKVTELESKIARLDSRVNKIIEKQERHDPQESRRLQDLN